MIFFVLRIAWILTVVALIVVAAAMTKSLEYLNAYIALSVVLGVICLALNPRGVWQHWQMAPYYEASPRKVHTDTGWIIFEAVYAYIVPAFMPLAVGYFLFEAFSNSIFWATIALLIIALPAPFLHGNRNGVTIINK